MARVQINMDIQEIVNIVSQLSNTELGNFKQQIDKIWQNRNSTETVAVEKELLEDIKSEILKKELKRYELLSAKNEPTEREQKESLDLFLKIQKDYSRRVEVADKLAKLQGIPFKTIIEKHGLLNEANV